MPLSTLYEKLFHVIVSTLLVSIPEEVFLVMFTLFLLKEFDFLESNKDGENRFKKADIVRIGFIVIFTAILSNIMRYMLSCDSNIILFVCIFTIFTLIVILYQLYWSIIDILKALVFTIISFMILLASEIIYSPIVFNIMGKAVSDINNSILLNFLLSLPSKIIQYSVLTYFLVKKSCFLKASILKVILRSRILLIATVAYLLYNILIFSVLCRLLIFGKILQSYSVLSQIVVSVLVIVFPIINLIIYLGVIFYKENAERKKNFIIKQDLQAAVSDMKRFAKHNNYNKLNTTIDDMQKDIEKII